MIGLWDVIYGGIVPAAAAAAALAFVWRATGKAASAWRTALVVGYLAGHWALDAQNTSWVSALTNSFRPNEARDWLPLFALLAMVPDAFACVGTFGPAVGWLLRFALCVFVPWRLLYGSVHLPIPLEGLEIDLGGWSTREAVTWIGGITVISMVAWFLSRSVQPQASVRLRSTLATLVAFASALAMAMSASLVYGQLFGVLTATLTGCGLASALLKMERGPDVAAGPIVVLFVSLLIVGHFYAELKLQNGVLLLIALVLAIGWLPRLNRKPAWQPVGRSVLCLATLGLVLTLAGRDFATSTSPESSNPQESLQP